MNDEVKDDNEILDAVDGLEIGELRKAAKALGIPAERTWVKKDFIEAIQKKQNESGGVMNFMPNAGDAPAPGYARLVIHRNPAPGHKNTPIHVGFNGMLYQIPRGINVDVPKEFIGVLKDAVVKETREVEPGKYVEEDQPSYPFQVLAITPGKWKNPNDNRAAAFKIRKDFFNKHGVWPTAGELREFKASRNKN